jgi:hypothetical protein
MPGKPRQAKRTMYEMHEEEGSGRRPPLKSFFTRRLEVKLQERGMDLPPEFISILDVPFDSFTEEQEAFYQVEFKPFTYFFIEILIDLYEALGAHREGWEDMMGRLPDCPIKELVKLALHEKARLEGFDDGVEEEPAFDPLELCKPITMTPEKRVVKTYRPSQSSSPRKERWWEKKVF